MWNASFFLMGHVESIWTKLEEPSEQQETLMMKCEKEKWKKNQQQHEAVVQEAAKINHEKSSPSLFSLFLLVKRQSRQHHQSHHYSENEIQWKGGFAEQHAKSCSALEDKCPNRQQHYQRHPRLRHHLTQCCLICVKKACSIMVVFWFSILFSYSSLD